ncbi:S-layer homology domain-containing protein [Paenibacillus sp. GCM10012303]|uniref:S-layer homology domain-containing protein n=1 Tax=Paenibacillus sp. GCM10012303 TaxID=3317340 RepID=UPI003609039A
MKRKMKKTLKQAVVYSIVSTMVLAAPAYAEINDNKTNTGTSQSSSNSNTNSNTGSNANSNIRLGFPDVPSSHWAIKHVSKLALIGIVQGDDQGKFNPENSVNQQDAIIMAIRMMGFEKEALDNKTTIALPFEDVRTDARPYVAYAINKGLIDLQEEVAGGMKWGNQDASREWVAKIVIRAVGKKQEALNKSNLPTGFADNTSISSSTLGYINEAISLGIVNGFEDNTFRPEGSVTRAQMATFLSRAEKYLVNPSDKVMVGTITSISGNRLTILEKNGQKRDVQLHSNASFYTFKDDTAKLTSSDVKLYNEVYILQNQGTAYFVEVTNDEIPMSSITGKLVSVNINDLTASLEVDGKYYTYDLASNVTIRDLNGAGISLGSLLENSVLELKKHALIEDAKISQIIVKQVPLNKTFNGSFQSFDPAALTVTVTDKDTGLIETYEISDRSAFVQGDKYFDPANLFEGDIVRVQIKNSVVISVEVVQQLVEKRDQGRLVTVSDDKTIVTIQKTGDELASYKVSDRVIVLMEGSQFGSVRDLMPGDDLKLEINQNKIDKIAVQSRSIQNFTLATVHGYDADTKFLTVIDELGKPMIYKLTDKTRLLFDNNEIPLASFQSNFVKGKRVNIVASEGTLLSVQVATRMEGTITSVSSTSGDITVKTASGAIQTYKTMSYAGVDKYSLPNAKLSDLRQGDFVRGFFDATQETVVGLSVRESLIVHTVSKEADGSRITIRDSAGNTSSYSMFGIPVHRNGLAVGVAGIAVDEPLQVTFIGRTLENVQALDTVRGKVTAVDAASGKVTVTDYTGISRVVEAGTSAVVKHGANTYTLAALKADDRVEIVKDTAGATTIRIITGEQRGIYSYDASTREMTFERRNLNDKVKYLLHEKAYISQGTQIIQPTALNPGDRVTVYFVNDKVVEIAKP